MSREAENTGCHLSRDLNVPGRTKVTCILNPSGLPFCTLLFGSHERPSGYLFPGKIKPTEIPKNFPLPDEESAIAVSLAIPGTFTRFDPATSPPRIRDVPVGLPAAWLFGCPGQWLVFNPPPVISASKRIALRPPHASSISSYFLFVFC